MRKLAAISLLIIFSAQTIYNLGVTVYWLANRQHIAATRCINRNRPELLCSGRCFLNTHLVVLAAEKSGSNTVHQTLPALKKNNEISDYLPPFMGLPGYRFAGKRPCTLVREYCRLRSRLLGCDIFRPPAPLV